MAKLKRAIHIMKQQKILYKIRFILSEFFFHVSGAREKKKDVN
jgi:hypothetical protein